MHLAKSLNFKVKEYEDQVFITCQGYYILVSRQDVEGFNQLHISVDFLLRRGIIYFLNNFVKKFKF